MIEQEQADVVVIGSGMGGLAAARTIAQFGGHRVLVLEQHYTLGGMTHEFTRAGRYSFGTGLHYLSADAGPFLDYLTDGRIQLQPLPDDYDMLHFPDFDFAVPAGADRLRERLLEHFPGEADAIDAFTRTTRRAMTGLAAHHVLAAMPAPVRRLGLPIVERLFPSTYRSSAEQLARSFRDPRLRAVLAARWGLYGTAPSSSAFGFHAAVPLTFFREGTAHPVGGPAEVGRIILQSLAGYAVTARPRQRVDRIVTDRGRVTGVDVTDTATGRRYRVDTGTVVSAAGTRNTYALIGRGHELAGLPAESSAVMLFLGMTRSPARFGVHGENHWFMPGLDDEHGIVYVSFPSLNNPAARAHTVEVLELLDPAVVDRWTGTSPQQRPDDYRAFKQRITDRLLDRLEQQWPGFRAAVGHAELATPLTFETYQHSVRGSFYGLAATPQRLRSSRAGSRTRIRGLHVAGQDAWGSGVVGALAGGLMAATAVLTPRQAGTMWRTVRSTPVPDRRVPWEGYLRVAAVEDLTADVRRIRFAPLRPGPLPFTVVAGQYLTLDLPVAVEPVARSYSICSGPDERGFVEIAVKREPDGLGSGFLHTEIAVGQALRVNGPHGTFTWTPGDAAETLLLIGGGIGVTPLMSVLAAAAHAGCPGRIVLLASHRTAAGAVFAAELAALETRLPGLHVRTVITSRDGRIGPGDLRPYAGAGTRVHLCGPAPMMQDLIGHLTDLGVPRDAVHTEAFVSGRSRQTRRERAHAIALAATAPVFMIGRAGDGPGFPCRPGQTVLEAAADAGVPLPQSCGEGSCGTCRIRVVAGECETDGRGLFSTAEQADGWTLACQTLPTGDLVIGLSPLPSPAAGSVPGPGRTRAGTPPRN
ncbi:2Fe-2S iron-sulfur cluster-binding protein [Actinoplanes sp. NBRC 101535]|uniref:2Fe-2S iron-sulfur cluster-binding protein n=1 Tax=Actinoplanes sp. NBRC 101535 TaxID=3032196 RepID=UPI0025544AB0|nr:2Fe-2S iron-sulfur cluster-binding protein [Actinoplanes sp. NBRC 101535]